VSGVVLTEAEMADLYGQRVPAKFVMLLLAGGRLFHREADGWHEYAPPRL